MRELDLTRDEPRADFVVYFGGRPSEVDTYTFANSLVAISDAIKVINADVNPGFSIELRLEAVGEGSFQARIKEIPKSLKSVLKFADQRIIWPILVAWFYTQVIAPDETNIIVNSDEVIIEKDGDRIIIPRDAYERAKKLPHDRVGAPVARAIQAVESDQHVSSLAIRKDLHDRSPPALFIDRKQFAIVRRRAEMEAEENNIRAQTVEAHLPIVKAVFSKGSRKWDFVWNGVKIGASIEDAAFMANVMARKHKIGAGDSLHARMRIQQRFDDHAGVWLNTSYHVEEVLDFVPGLNDQGDLLR